MDHSQRAIHSAICKYKLFDGQSIQKIQEITRTTLLWLLSFLSHLNPFLLVVLVHWISLDVQLLHGVTLTAVGRA